MSIENTIERIQVTREAGQVQRCHIVPHIGDASDAQHSWNMATMYRILCPEPKLDVVWCILHHDNHERYTGDAPMSAKMMAQSSSRAHIREFRDSLSAFDEHITYQMGDYFELPDEDWAWVKGLDMLEFYLFCHDQLAFGNRRFERPAKRVKDRLVNGGDHDFGVPQPIVDVAEAYIWSRTVDTSINYHV